MATATARNPERTNRWLLIGAAVLALLTFVLVALVLTNTGDDGDAPGVVEEGDRQVLVATRNIEPNTRIEEGMFELKPVPGDLLITLPVTAEEDVIGQVTNSDILQGEQLSAIRLVRGAVDPTLAAKIEEGMRGYSVRVDDVGSVSGLLVPGDRVDVVIVSQEERGDETVTRVETLLQDVKVLARAQESVEARPLELATPQATVQAGEEDPAAAEDIPGNDVRREELEPDPGARTVTLELSPQQVHQITAAQDRGRLVLSLRSLGDDEQVPVSPVFRDQFGFIPPTPAP